MVGMRKTSSHLLNSNHVGNISVLCNILLANPKILLPMYGITYQETYVRTCIPPVVYHDHLTKRAADSYVL